MKPVNYEAYHAPIQQIFFSLLLNNSYIYDMFLLELLNQ